MQERAKSRSGPVAALLLAALSAAGLPAAGAEGDEPPNVPLERLLQLPPSAPVPDQVEKRSGATKGQWQARFQAARGDLEAARQALEETRAELEELSVGEAWTMTAPGLGGAVAPTDSPLDYKLSQQLRRQRDELERAERQIQDLEVEANLAGVPESWRHPDARPSQAVSSEAPASQP